MSTELKALVMAVGTVSLFTFSVFIVSFVFSFIAVALILKLSLQNRWFDRMSERKIHTGDVPRLGGIGFALVFLLVAAGILLFTADAVSDLHYLPCLIALFIILAFGVVDDFISLAPRYKLLVQLIAALIVIIPGFTFNRISYLGMGFLPESLGFMITLLWIVGLSNAINLIDGIDGLAGGLSLIIAMFFGIIFSFYGITPQKLLFCIALIGVLGGFLSFNAPMPKAKIFMGDGGSQFLGFILALLPLLATPGTRASLPVPYAAALLLIPILDTIAAVWRRIRDRRHIASADRAHVHHKLMNLGLSVRGVDAVLYSLQIVLGVLVFVSVSLDGPASLYVLGSAYITGIGFFSAVHFLNRAVQKKSGLQEIPVNTTFTN